MAKPTERTIDLADVRHIERVTIGSLNPTDPQQQLQTQRNIDKLNNWLKGVPKGIIIGRDISCQIYQHGEHQLVCQQVSYIIGFKRKPPD